MQFQKHQLNDKSIADVCEAIIGASLLSFQESGDMDMAVKAVTKFVKNADHDVQQWDDYYKLYTKPAYQITESSAAQIDLAKQIEESMGYRFEYPRLLRSAFSHPSYPFCYEKIPSYQRLEFLGDSLLDMACINFLFHRYPDKDPQWLTEHKVTTNSPLLRELILLTIVADGHGFKQIPRRLVRPPQILQAPSLSPYKPHVPGPRVRFGDRGGRSPIQRCQGLLDRH